MRVIASAFILSLCISSYALGGNLEAKKEKTGIVYTNIGISSFFSRAFKIGKSRHYAKTKIIRMIRKTALRIGVEPKIALSIAKVESDFRHNSTSSSGAKGVMQLMKKTAASYGVKDINNLQQNIEGGIRFLKHLTKKYKNIKLVAAAYNAGETAVDKYKGIPPYSETVRYVKKFMNAYNGKNTPIIKKTVYMQAAKPVKKIGTNLYSNVGGIW